MAERLKFIENIYFDTNILIRIPLEGISSDFLNLRDICNKNNIGLFIPEFVQKEYIKYNTKFVKDGLSSIKEMNKRLSAKIYLPQNKDNDQILKDVEEFSKQRILDLGITVLERQSVSLEALEEMALNNIRPFESEGRKGFRDADIFLSILEHAKKDRKGYNLFLTDDKIFVDKTTKPYEDIEKIIKSYQVDIKFLSSLTQAIEEIKRNKAIIIDVIRKVREDKLKTFLRSQSSEVIEFIRNNGEFNSFSFALGDIEQKPLLGTVKKINAIDFEDIHSARAEFLPKDQSQGRIKISFMVKSKFSIVVEQLPYSWGEPLRLVQSSSSVSGDMIPQVLGTTSPLGTLFSIPISTEQTIRRNVSVEGSVFVEDDFSLKVMKELQLDRVWG